MLDHNILIFIKLHHKFLKSCYNFLIFFTLTSFLHIFSMLIRTINFVSNFTNNKIARYLPTHLKIHVYLNKCNENAILFAHNATCSQFLSKDAHIGRSQFLFFKHNGLFDLNMPYV